LYDDVVTLRRSGLTYKRIIEEIYRGYRVRITKAHVSYWTRGLHNPHKGRRILSLEFLEPSDNLAYVIGVRCGDGHAKAKKATTMSYILRPKIGSSSKNSPCG